MCRPYSGFAATAGIPDRQHAVTWHEIFDGLVARFVVGFEF